MNEGQARAKTYGSKHFAGEVAEILQRDKKEVSMHLNALLEAGRVPTAASASKAEWAASREAARILAAIGSRQVNAASIIRVSDRILAMTYQCDVAIPGHARTGPSVAKKPCSFEDGLATAISGIWAANLLGTELPIPSNVTITWNESGSILYGTIDATKRGVRALYSTANIAPPPGMTAGSWDFVCSDAVGGSAFVALSILGFAELIRDAFEARQ